MRTPLTIFSFGYYGWGSHTRDLVKIVDASEETSGYEPPLWVDIRYHRNVRAAGFNGNAFASLLGPSRYLWMQGLGNRAISGATGGIKIHDPQEAQRLLMTARSQLKTQGRRTIFFCSCASWSAKVCHRYTVGALLLQAAKRERTRLAVCEWPGNEPTGVIKDVSSSLLAKISRLFESGVPDLPLEGPLASLPKDLPYGAEILFRAGNDAVAIIAGPANPAQRWKMPMLGRYGDTMDEKFRKKLLKAGGYDTRGV